MSPTAVALPLRRTIERLPGLMRDLVERLRAGRLDEPERRTDLPIQFDIAPLVTALRLLGERTDKRGSVHSSPLGGDSTTYQAGARLCGPGGPCRGRSAQRTLRRRG